MLFTIKRKQRKFLNESEKGQLQQMLTEGYSNREIATTLDMSESCVSRKRKKFREEWEEVEIKETHEREELKQYVIYLEKNRKVMCIVVEAGNALKAAKKSKEVRNGTDLEDWVTTDIKYIK